MLPSAAATLNPQFHDEFVALCALYYSGEISEEEWALLQIHMGYCDSCQKKFLEYQQVTSEVIPAIAAVAASEVRRVPGRSANDLDEAEQELMRRLDSSPPRGEVPSRSHRGRLLPLALIAAGVLGFACLTGLYFTRVKPQPSGRVDANSKPSNAVAADRSAQNTEQELDRSKRQVTALEQEIATTNGRLKQVDLARTEIESQLKSEQNTQKQLNNEKAQLSQQLAAAETELDSMRSKEASAGRDADQRAADTVGLEAQVRELKADLEEKSVELSEKDRMLALDKDFLSRDREIRDLIGARNLYIADIFDTNENGKTAKQFGRVFYTRDRSLIFYGFDLDSPAGHRQDVSFQVWGSGSDRSGPVSLGLFYQDDSHKRWVLRCTDAKALARLDMVFVTVEPPGGSAKPTGKQLLRAYLQIHPNHP